MKKWRVLCDLPQGEMPFLQPWQQRTARLLDDLESIYPVPSDPDLDKFGALSEWVDTAPLLGCEVHFVRQFIAENIC